jgi:beta-aspartyl-peptidase (threonine type)
VAALGGIITERWSLGPGVLAVAHGGVDMEASHPTYVSLEAATGAASALLVDSGLEAALAAVSVLEDDPAFNCGFGSVLTREGTVETDGAISFGARAVGVGAVPGVRHPAQLAFRLMQEENTVLLVGREAASYATSLGFRQEDLVTAEQRAALDEFSADPTRSVFTGRSVPSETVGCITVDGAARVASASSTGGLLGKLPGRVGDACVPGAGIWTDERYGVLCSGSGEAAMRGTLARSVALRARHMDLPAAVEESLREVTAEGAAVCAIVAVDGMLGEVATAHNGASFPVVVRRGAEVIRLGVQNSGADAGAQR